MPFQPEITAYANLSANVIQAMASQASTQSVITITAAASGDSQSNSGDSSDNNDAVKIGAGVGVPLGIAFLAALGMFLYERRARQRLQKELEARDIAAGSKQPPVQAAYSPGYTSSDGSNTVHGGHGSSSPYQKYIPEVHGNHVTPSANELSSAVPPQELPGSGNELHR